MKKIFLILILSVFLLIPTVSNAETVPSTFTGGLGGSIGNLDKALGSDKQGLAPNLETGIGNIIGGALALVGTIFLILTVYGGITWMIAMGNSDKTEKAKEIIVAAVIGLAITMGAYAITVFVTGRLNPQDTSGICYSNTSCGTTSSADKCPTGTTFMPGGNCDKFNAK